MPKYLNYSTDTFYGIICSGLSKKTQLSFTSSNSSFTECERKYSLYTLSSFPSNNNCYSSPYKECQFSPHSQEPSLSTAFVTFISCTFNDFISSSGAAICFTSGDTLSVDQCSFTDCKSTHSFEHYEGAGGVLSNCGSLLSVTSSTFISCVSESFGGGVLATKDCKYATVSLCSFFTCTANHGGGVSVFFGPSSSVSSCRFLCCTADAIGGGLYHDSKTPCFFTASNLLFTENTANYNGDRGGGGFEDRRNSDYSITISFFFFNDNKAPSGVGNDLSMHYIPLIGNDILHCFTTTSSRSFWNKDSHDTNWLPLFV